MVAPTTLAPPAAREDGPPPGPQRGKAGPGDAALAALLAGAGLVHVAMAPAHLTSSAADGVGFLVVGVVQLLVAVLVVARPSRAAYGIAAGVSAVARRGVAREPDGRPPLRRPRGRRRERRVRRRGDRRPRRPGPHRRRPPARTRVRPACRWRRARRCSPSERSRSRSPRSPRHRRASTGTTTPRPREATATAPRRPATTSGSPSSRTARWAPTSTEAAPADELDAAIDPGRDAARSPRSWPPPPRSSRPTRPSPTPRPPATARPGPFSPGLGVHYIGPGAGSGTPTATWTPRTSPAAMLIFDGIEDDSRLAGFMYMSYQETAPEGFVGDLDQWHYHTAVCIVVTPDGIDTPFGADLTGVTQEMCEAEGGTLHRLHRLHGPRVDRAGLRVARGHLQRPQPARSPAPTAPTTRSRPATSAAPTPPCLYP